jgi:GNAT superfamily N-acetyltransferase
MRRDFVLRRLLPSDADAFHAMALAAWLDAYTGLVPEDVAADASRMISAAMASRFDRFVVAFDDGEPIGYYSLGDAPEDQNYLWHLYVDPRVQRRGTGTLLHDAALVEIRKRGWDHATLDFVAGNEKAARFYAHHGWVESGRTVSDGLNLVLMRRDL